MMNPEKQISGFVSRLRDAAGNNLQSVVLYGSAASGDFHPEFSDLNLLCILGDASFPALNALAPAVDWWTKQKLPPPLMFTLDEMKHSADVFAIEFMDMQASHRVLFGEDVLTHLDIPLHLHRAQVEYELREKLLLLRRGLLLAAGKEARQWDLMLRSVPAFTTLFRHALIAFGAPATASKRDAIQQLSVRIKFDPAAFLQLLDIREHKADRKQFNVTDLFTRYLAAVEQVTAAVDTMLDSTQHSTGPHSS
jgi:hypothetical protein